MQKTDLWTFQDDITKSLNAEQYIQSEFGELNPRNINTRKSSATITDVSIKFSNEYNKLMIKISHKGKTYICENKLSKQNIEYLCGLTNIKEFKIDEIIGSEIKFTNITKNKLIIKTNYLSFIPHGLKPTFINWILIMLYMYLLFGTFNAPIHIITITLSIVFGYHTIENKNKESKVLFEFTSLSVKQ